MQKQARNVTRCAFCFAPDRLAYAHRPGTENYIKSPIARNGNVMATANSRTCRTLPQLHPDPEETARLVRGRVPRLVGQVGLAVNSVTAPRLLCRAQLRRPFYDRRTIDHRYRRGEHRVRVGRFTRQRPATNAILFGIIPAKKV